MNFQAYNEEKRRNRHVVSNNPLEGLSSDPPPYSPAAPPHINQRWISSGHPPREPVPSPDLPNPRYPHNCIPGTTRLPHEGARFPVTYGSGRFPRGYVGGGPGPNSRMSMYSGPNVPSGGMIHRTPMSRMPQSHGIVPTNEAYPFSEKLKEQASMYRAEGMHAHPGPVGFEMNLGEPMVGPRMGSPDWHPYPSNQVPINRGLPHIPPEGMSSPGSGIGSAPMISNSMGNPMEAGMPPSVDPSIDPGMAMQMHNPPMGASFANKGSLPNYPASSLSGMPGKPFPRDLRASTNPTLDGSNSGMMGDTMARRGESRPPDLNINPTMARSSPGFHGGMNCFAFSARSNVFLLLLEKIRLLHVRPILYRQDDVKSWISVLFSGLNVTSLLFDG